MENPVTRKQLSELVLAPASSSKGIRSQVMILERSVDFIAAKSASRITLQAVADYLELSKGAIQAHFKTSDSLLASVLYYILRLNLESLVTTLDKVGGNFSHGLFHIIDDQIEWAVSKYNVAQLDIQFCARAHTNLEKLIKEVLGSIQQMTHSTLIRGMNLDGEFYQKYLAFREALILKQISLGTHAVIFDPSMPALGIRSLEAAKAKAIEDLKQLHQTLWPSDITEQK
jgi:AcrR family transcriptional regulator